MGAFSGAFEASSMHAVCLAAPIGRCSLEEPCSSEKTVGICWCTAWCCNGLGGITGPGGEDQAEPIGSTAVSKAPLEPESSTAAGLEGSLPGDFFEVRHRSYSGTVADLRTK